MSTLAEVLARETRTGDLYETLSDGRLRCFACGHCCPLPEGAIGVCKVRYNEGGRLLVPWGYVGGVQCDPIEKKPFFHAHPGALAYSFGMLGCDLHCGYCQNWVTSQALRDPAAVAPPLRATPPARAARAPAEREASARSARVGDGGLGERAGWGGGGGAGSRGAEPAALPAGFAAHGNATPKLLRSLPHGSESP